MVAQVEVLGRVKRGARGDFAGEVGRGRLRVCGEVPIPERMDLGSRESREGE